MDRRLLLGVVGLGVALGACVDGSSSDAVGSGELTNDAPLSPEPASADTPVRSQLDGRDFPPRVLALTWDDGPDVHTLELARYLNRKHVVGTFFVIREWEEGRSSDPGYGRDVFGTGYDALPMLGDLVALGHRVGNHTENHVLLSEVPPIEVARQLRDNQERIGWLEDNDLHLFRVPGGAWSAAASHAVDGDPELAGMVGPVRWDIDQKDWDGSIACRSRDPANECEPLGPGGTSRVKPAVMAKRYLAAIERRGRGIVLLHDRVGHVGSTYALDLARVLIPELEARGYVFAAPVLAFSPLARCQEKEAAARPTLADVNGDGRADSCTLVNGAVECALGSSRGLTRGATWLRSPALAHASHLELVDVNGDGRADVRVHGQADEGLLCALAP